MDNGRLSPDCLMDTLKIFKAEYSYLSPLYGAALCGSLYIPNIYAGAKASCPDTSGYSIFQTVSRTFSLNDVSVETCDATTTFVRKLFHKVGNEPLHVTRNKSSPIAFITPALIGHWIGLNETNQLNTEKMLAVLEEPLYRISRCSRTALKHLINLLPQSNNEGNSQQEQVQAQPRQLSQHLFQQLLQLPQQPDPIYFRHIGTTILLAVLWLISDRKECLGEYLLTLSQYIEPFTIHNSIINAEWKERKLPSLRHMLGESDTDVIRCMDFIMPHYEQLTATLLNSVYLSLPHVPASSFAPKLLRHKQDTFPCVPDCVERTIRGFINRIIYDHDLDQLSWQTMQELAVEESILQFYQKNYTNSSICERSSGQAWFDLMCSRSKVNYIRGYYEVRPQMANLLVIFQQIFNKTITNWKDLATVLSFKGRELKVLHEVRQPNDTGEVLFSYKYRSREIIIKIEVQSNHCYLKLPHMMSDFMATSAIERLRTDDYFSPIFALVVSLCKRPEVYYTTATKELHNLILISSRSPSQFIQGTYPFLQSSSVALLREKFCRISN